MIVGYQQFIRHPSYYYNQKTDLTTRSKTNALIINKNPRTFVQGCANQMH